MQQLYEELVEPFLKEDAEFVIRKAQHSEDYTAMTCVPAFMGENFDSEKVKLMLIGRAVNGWSADWNGNAKEIAKQALSIEFSMKSIDKCPHQNVGTPDEYNFNKCAFMKLGKEVARNLGLKTETISGHLLWSNLYKVAPIISGNPNGKMQKIQRQTAIKILKKEIEKYNPSHILFVTDIDWLQATWKNNKTELSFANALNITEDLTINNGKYVKAYGMYSNIPYVVCVRPEKRPIVEMTKDIIEAFKRV